MRLSHCSSVLCLSILFLFLSTVKTQGSGENVIWSVLDGGGNSLSPRDETPSSSSNDCAQVTCSSQEACREHGCTSTQCARFPAQIGGSCTSQSERSSETYVERGSSDQRDTTTMQDSDGNMTTETTSHSSRWENAFANLRSRRLLLKNQFPAPPIDESEEISSSNLYKAGGRKLRGVDLLIAA